MLRRTTELENVGGGGGGDGVEDQEADDTGLVDGNDEAAGRSGAAEEVKGDDAGGATDANSEAEGDIDTFANGDTRRELVIAVRCMNEAGLSDYLKSLVGGQMRGQNLSTCLSRTVSVAQFAYEKVTIIFHYYNRSKWRPTMILFKFYDAMMPGVEIIDTICEICTLRGLVCVQDYFVYLEVNLNKEPSTVLSFLMV
jgi:hypothetical protein